MYFLQRLAVGGFGRLAVGRIIDNLTRDEARKVIDYDPSMILFNRADLVEQIVVTRAAQHGMRVGELPMIHVVWQKTKIESHYTFSSFSASFLRTNTLGCGDRGSCRMTFRACLLPTALRACLSFIFGPPFEKSPRRGGKALIALCRLAHAKRGEQWPDLFGLDVELDDSEQPADLIVCYNHSHPFILNVTCCVSPHEQRNTLT